MYEFFNIFFFVFHSGVIVFNLFGWIWKKTRIANLIALLLTLFSWFILGIWYGFGFCPCTEWHWQVRMKLDHYDMPASYTKFLIDSLTGLNVNQRLVDISAVLLIALALFASLLTNIKDWKRKKTDK